MVQINNMFNMLDRIFYTKENGEVYECFKNKPMILIDDAELNDLIMHGRQKQIKFASIAERQVNELKKIIKGENSKETTLNNEIIINSYHDYNILSDEEYKELIEFLKL